MTDRPEDTSGSDEAVAPTETATLERPRRKPRGKLTLRIPDDEIARPTPSPGAVAAFGFDAATPASDRLPPVEAAPIQPTPIIAVGIPSDPPPPVAEVARPRAPALLGATDDSWTPYQPTVADKVGDIEVDFEVDDPLSATMEMRVPPVSAISLPDSELADEDDEDEGIGVAVAPPPPRPVAPSAPPPAAVLQPPRPRMATLQDSVPPPAPRGMTHSSPPAALPPSVRPATLDLPSIIIEEAPVTRVERAAAPTTAPRPKAEDTAPHEALSVHELDEALEEEDTELSPDTPIAGIHAVSSPAPRLDSKPPPPPPARPPLVIVPSTSDAASASSGADFVPKRKTRLWYEELFGDDFLRATPRLTDAQIAAEVNFIEDSLGVASGGAMLDLACGDGRHAIELARRGYQTVGFDLSLTMLARAGDEAQDRGAKLNFVQGDMREMTFENTFDGVVCWNTSFGYFEEEKNAAVIANIHRSLRAEGTFLLDVVNRDFVINQAPSLVWFEGEGCVCMDEMQMDWITSRMRVKRTLMLDDGRSRELEYTMRTYSLHELGKLLHEQGFRIVEASGRTSTPGVFFGPTSPRIIILAEKK